ncbi:MAG: DUF6125 family protein [Actinomycetota bacterium]|nr:DUF6125 family protein [Actinomycetota bacterium]
MRGKTVAGKVTWEELKQELMELDKEKLVELVNMWVRNYWTNQNYWMMIVERDFGFENAGRIDGEVWENTGKAQAYRLKKLLGLGDDTQALATVLKYCAAQWVNAGFEWEFLEVGPKKVVMRVNKCPMGTYRGEKGLPLLPCKLGSPPLYIAIAKAVNENFQVRCLHAHPDPPIEGVMCEWEFVLEDERGG